MNIHNCHLKMLACLLYVSVAGASWAAPCASFKAEDARQAAAVDDRHVYAIDSSAIGKYDKHTGEVVKRWQASEELPLRHLNSGVTLDGKLYCAHSNYPALPMTSSIEVWDTETMAHVDSHSFGIRYGSCTWIDRHDNHWWILFAHYGAQKGYPDKDESWTTLIQFDDAWQELEGYVFPERVLERFRPNSCSGGSWGPDNRLYCTGHDHPELYVMSLPRAGSELVFNGVLSFGIDGQGIAFDRSGSDYLYGIIRDERRIIAAPIQTLLETASSGDAMNNRL